MRIKCNPKEAKFAMKDGVELVNDQTGIEPIWKTKDKSGFFNNCISTNILQTLGFTFETDLPPVPDGKEYEYKQGDGSGAPLPEGTWFFNKGEVGWWLIKYPLEFKEFTHIYAIPIKKESCVVEGVVLYNTTQSVALEKQIPGGMSVLVIPKCEVLVDYNKDGQRLIVVREDK